MGRARGQEAALATSILWEVDPHLDGGASPRTSSSPPSGHPETHHPHPPQLPRDGLNQSAGQTEKLEAKVGVGPEASRPGKEPQGSLGTNGHTNGHTGQGTWPLTCAGAQRTLLIFLVSWVPAGWISVLYPVNAWIPMGTHASYSPQCPQTAQCRDGLGAMNSDSCTAVSSRAGQLERGSSPLTRSSRHVQLRGYRASGDGFTSLHKTHLQLHPD